MSFGGTNNPPWQRNSIGNANQQIPSLSQLGIQNPNMVGFQGNQSMYNQNLGMTQHQPNNNNNNNMSLIPSLGGGGGGGSLNSNQLFNQTVSYPTRGGGGGGGASGSLNLNAFAHTNNQQTNSINRIGIVTKLQNDFGFIDEEIFFHKNSCKGTYPKLGDRVMVEATFSSNAAFKWTASRVQMVGSQQNQGRSQPQSNQRTGGSGYNAVPPPNAYAGFDRSGQQSRQRNLSPVPTRRQSSDRHAKNHDSRADEDDRKRRREEREKDKERVKDKRAHSNEVRDHSPVRRSSPKRPRNRFVPRYMVQIPKVTLNM